MGFVAVHSLGRFDILRFSIGRLMFSIMSAMVVSRASSLTRVSSYPSNVMPGGPLILHLHKASLPGSQEFRIKKQKKFIGK